MNYTKKRKILIYYVPLLALLLSLCIPSMHARAKDIDAESLSRGTEISINDSIKYSTIEISYYDAEGKYITKEKGTTSLSVSKQYDPLSGTDYENYTITALNIDTESVSISLKGIHDSNKPVLTRTLDKLIVKTPPQKTVYTEGESFNSTGMVIMLCYSDGSWRDVTSYTITPNGALSTNNKNVTIRFTENNQTVSTTQNITVNAKDPDGFVISASAAAGGSISDAGGHYVSRGDSKTYTISPNSGYRINYVEVDGSNVGAVSSYTFDNVQGEHSITAYFLSGTTASQNNAAKRNLTIVGSFAAAGGAGSYLPGTKVNVDAGYVPGFAFAGWIASDGIIYPLPAMSYVMPGYDVLLYANWIQSGTPNALSQITTTNLKGQQLTSWTDITNKLATFNANDMAQPGSPVMKVTAGGINCYIDAAAIAMLNTRQGIALDVSYGTDASFTFYSNLDNSQYKGTDFSYTSTTGMSLFFHEKKLVFTQQEAINTGICLNVSLPDAQPGQTAYVYLVNEKGAEIMYLPAVVDAEKKISIPLSAKINLNIKY